MIEISSVVSCISKEEFNIDKLNKSKHFTYLCKENIVDKKINNNIINKNKNINKININKNLVNINFINNKIKQKSHSKNNWKYKHKQKIKKTYFIREKKIDKYKKFKEKIKDNIKNRINRYNEIVNLMYKKIKKTSYLKNNKIKL